MTNNPVQHARDALAGNIEVPAPTVICNVCEREILASTAFAIPAIGFMCPRGTKDCKPQRSIWDEVRDQEAKDRNRRIDAIADLFLNWDSDDESSWEVAQRAFEIAVDPTRIIEGTR